MLYFKVPLVTKVRHAQEAGAVGVVIIGSRAKKRRLFHASINLESCNKGRLSDDGQCDSKFACGVLGSRQDGG